MALGHGERRRYETRMSRSPLPLEGALNFRDLGGLGAGEGGHVVQGRVYRSDGLHRLSPADRQRLEPLGIERIFDLRSDIELTHDGIGEFAGAVDRHRHVPLVATSLNPFDTSIDWRSLDLTNRYVDMLGEGAETIRVIVEFLASSPQAVSVFHCTGGKDRTGVVAAVVLRALGVSDADIVADYSVSEHNLRGGMERFRPMMQEQGFDDEAVAYLTSSPPQRMWHTLHAMDSLWGGVEGYLEQIGVGPCCVRDLRSSLLV